MIDAGDTRCFALTSHEKTPVPEKGRGNTGSSEKAQGWVDRALMMGWVAPPDGTYVPQWSRRDQEELAMKEVSIIGVDLVLAKQVFQLHGATAEGEIVFRKNGLAPVSPDTQAVAV